jgi:hypothetical protein
MKRRLAVAVAVVMSLLAFPAFALANECIVDLAGSGTAGPLTSHEAYPLGLAQINTSSWSSPYAYDAVRTFSDGTVSYDVSYPSGGDHNYGTAGNALRRTWFDSDISGSNNSWAVQEDQIC